MKKIVASVFSVLFLVMAMCTALPVIASNELSVEISAPAELKSGEQLCVTVTFKSLPTVGVCGLNLELAYDTRYLTYDSAELVDFPSKDWMVAGKAVSDGCVINAFDEYFEAHLLSGTKAKINLYFSTKENVNVKETLSAKSVGSVTGCFYNGSEIVSVMGAGGETEVYLYRYYPGGMSGDGWKLTGEYINCEPTVTAGDIKYQNGYVQGKSGDDILVTGDLFVIDGYKPIPIGVHYDVNGDGEVTTVDYLLMKKYLKSGVFPANGSFAACDVNTDGTVGTLDALLFRTVLSGGEV